MIDSLELLESGSKVESRRKNYTDTHTETQTERLTSELNLSWQTLHDMTCFFLGTKVTPKVWLMTAFCTGSICRRHTEVRGQQPGQ